MAWRDRRLLQCLGLRSSLIQAPMANAQARDMVIDAWCNTLVPYYEEYNVDLAKMTASGGGAQRKLFDETSLALVQELQPEVVSFHFGLPEWLDTVKATDALVLSTATTVKEARWLAKLLS